MAGLKIKKPKAAPKARRLKKFGKLQASQSPTNIFSNRRGTKQKSARLPFGKRAK